MRWPRRYSRDPNADPNALNAQYREAMRQTYARYPDDPEVGTMYADAVMNLRPWQLWSPDGTPGPDTLELVKVLEAVLRRHPNHPGANHYYVHAVEASATPERALASAARLETLVPGAGHLVHMPTHIYIHTGHIGRVAELNAKAAAADERYIEVAKPEGLYPFMYYGHNVHFVVVGNILIGRYEDARKAADQMAGMVAPHVAQMGPMVEWALSLPTLAHVRFHKWETILAAPRPPESQPLARSFDAYARALALQMTGKPDRGPRRGRRIRRRPREGAGRNARGELQQRRRPCWSMVSHLLQGQLAVSVDQAVRHLEMAAAAQDALTYDEPEPWPWSVRETLGAVLLKAGRAAEAETRVQEGSREEPGERADAVRPGRKPDRTRPLGRSRHRQARVRRGVEAGDEPAQRRRVVLACSMTDVNHRGTETQRTHRGWMDCARMNPRSSTMQSQ